ncbi:hypothetical protein HK405_013570, partial [Cladochytrium tenue]
SDEGFRSLLDKVFFDAALTIPTERESPAASFGEDSRTDDTLEGSDADRGPTQAASSLPPPLPSDLVEESPALRQHLLAVYLSRVQPRLYCILDEPATFATAPATLPGFLADAMCAMGALFSTHPELGAVAGRAQDAARPGWAHFFVPDRFAWSAQSLAACRFAERARRAVPEFSDPGTEFEGLACVQALQLLACFYYGFGNGKDSLCLTTAFEKAQAYRIALMAKLNREHPDISANPLSLLTVPKRRFTLEELRLRDRIWGFFMVLDTFSSIMSGLPLMVDEATCAHILTERPSSPTVESDDDRWRRFSESVASILPESTLRLPEHGPQSGDWISLNQILFLLRRILRLNATRRAQRISAAAGGSSGGGGGGHGEDVQQAARLSLLRSVLPQQDDDAGDAAALHEAVLRWHALLPARLRAFAALDCFVPRELVSYSASAAATAGGGGGGVPGPEFDWASAPAVACGVFVPAALAMLHLPRADATVAVGGGFRLRAGPAFERAGDELRPGQAVVENLRVSSGEVVVVAHRAQAALLRAAAAAAAAATAQGNSISSSSGGSGGGWDAAAYGAADGLWSGPTLAGAVFMTSTASLAVCGLQSGGAAGKARAVEAERTASQVDLPFLHSVGRVWPVARTFATRLEKVVEAVRAGF